MKPSAAGRRGGFTLIEVLLVLTILVILGSFAVGFFMNAQRAAYAKAAKAQVQLFDTPLSMYQLDIGDFPSTQQGLAALLSPPADLPNPQAWIGPYLKSVPPADPWGQPYQYMYPGRVNTNSYDVWSLGPDRTDGTADDIGNWTRE